MYVTSTPELLHGGNFTEIVNGTSVLPDILLQNITNTAINFKSLFNSQVLEATHTENDKTFLKLKKSNVEVESEEFDKVAFTVPARQVSLIKFSPLLDYAKQYALDSFHYMTSVRVFLAFKTPFWASSTNNTAPPIPFYDCTSDNCKPRGGSGITDLPIRNIFYPSHEFHGNAILATYVWEDDANLLTSFSDESLVELILDNLSVIHGEIVRQTYVVESGVVKTWIRDEFVGSGSIINFLLHEI